MSVAEVTGRIQQIQAQIQLIGPASGAGFAAALSGAGAVSTATTGATGATGTGSATGTGPVAGAVSGASVVADARKYLGVPYVWGGTDPQTGLDCSGLVQRVYRDLGYELPRVSYQQATVGRAVPSLSAAQPGDLLAFGSPVHHIAIYIGDGKMIEAPRPGKNVQVSSVYETPTAIRRVIGEVQPTGAPVAGAPVSGTSAAGAVSGRVAAGTVSPSVPYASLFNAASARYGVDAKLLAAVAKQESGYDPRAVSSAGAQGLMQLMPATARGLGVANSFDPAQAVDGASRMLRDLVNRFGSTDLALAAYNAGPGAVLKYDGIPPYPETQHYVRNVLAIREAM